MCTLRFFAVLSLYVYVCFICSILEIVSPHTRLYVWPAFCLYFFYVDNSLVLSTSSLESGVDRNTLTGWKALEHGAGLQLFISCIFMT